MPTMVQNVLSTKGLVNEDLFREEEYYSKGKKKTRIEFDFEKIIEVPEELKHEHSALNLIKIVFYLKKCLVGNCPAEENLAEDKKKKLFLERISDDDIYDLLNQRAHIDKLYEYTKTYTRAMSPRKEASFYKEGEALTENLRNLKFIDNWEYQLENWGCIWNASATKKIDDDTISFLTPDYPPYRVIHKLAERLTYRKITSQKSDMLHHIWFPEDYSASKIVGGGDLFYYKDGIDKKIKIDADISRPTLSEADVYDLYYQYKDDVLGAHKMSAFNTDSYDRFYFRLHEDLRDQFTLLCEREKTNLARAIRALAQKTVDDGAIPFDRKVAEEESFKYIGPMIHTNIRMPRVLHRDFDAIAHEDDTTINRLIVEYMMLCLDKIDILYKDKTE